MVEVAARQMFELEMRLLAAEQWLLVGVGVPTEPCTAATAEKTGITQQWTH